MKTIYRITVGNIGTAHEGTNKKQALAVFKEYVSQSATGYGRASGENVTLWENDEPTREHLGTLNTEN